MATKGVLIDITKPEKYQLKNGFKVIRIRNLDDGASHPLRVDYEDAQGDYFYQDHTMDGFYYSYESQGEFDLILREKIESSEPKKRKIVQIAAINNAVYALTNDGNIFYRYGGRHEWLTLPELPQD